MGVYFREAIKNIRANFLLNLAIVVLIVSVMTFLGIVAVQVQINDLKTSVVLNQEAFVELSQYYFYSPEKSYPRLVHRQDENHEKTVPANEAFLYYPLNDDPIITSQYINNSDKVWDLYRGLRNIPGVYLETMMQVGLNHDSYDGYIIPDTAYEYEVELDFFDVENLTLKKGRFPQKEDFQVDKDGIHIVPVIIGYQIGKSIDIGDVLVFKNKINRYDPDDFKKSIVSSYWYCKGIVVGILDKNNTVLHQDGKTLYNLAQCVLKVRTYPSPENYPELKRNNDIYVYSSWIALQELVNDKIYINKTNEEQAVEEIRKLLKETEIDVIFDIAHCDGYAKISAALEKGRAESYLQVAFCVGMLCVFGLGMLIVMLNVANSKDYAIHRLVGATKRDVALMTTVQMLILLLVSDVLIHYPYLLSKTGLFLNGDSMLYIFSGERKIYIVIAVLNISVLLLTYIISRVYAAKNEVSAAIKDKE
jgi:hypothetical protein